MSYRFGYARISTRDQDTGFQRKALLEAGVPSQNLFEEQESGARRDRPVLADVLSRLREGDTLVVWKFDRIARSAQHLLTIVDDLKARGVNFISLTEAVDISTPWGKMVLTVLAGVAEMERSMIEERRGAGIKLARDKGVKFGRKPANDPTATRKAADGSRITDDKSGRLAKALLAVANGQSIRSAAKENRIGEATVRRHISAHKSDASIPAQVSTQKSRPKSPLKGVNGHCVELR